MALHSLYCADVPLRNCSLTHSLHFDTDRQTFLIHILQFSVFIYHKFRYILVKNSSHIYT